MTESKAFGGFRSRYWGAAPNPAVLAYYQHFPAHTASASACRRPLTLTPIPPNTIIVIAAR